MLKFYDENYNVTNVKATPTMTSEETKQHWSNALICVLFLLVRTCTLKFPALKFTRYLLKNCVEMYNFKRKKGYSIQVFNMQLFFFQFGQ